MKLKIPLQICSLKFQKQKICKVINHLGCIMFEHSLYEVNIISYCYCVYSVSAVRSVLINRLTVLVNMAIEKFTLLIKRLRKTWRTTFRLSALN